MRSKLRGTLFLRRFPPAEALWATFGRPVPVDFSLQSARTVPENRLSRGSGLPVVTRSRGEGALGQNFDLRYPEALYRHTKPLPLPLNYREQPMETSRYTWDNLP